MNEICVSDMSVRDVYVNDMSVSGISGSDMRRQSRQEQHSARSGRQVGDKRETSATGDKCEIVRAENPECSGRQLGDMWADESTQIMRPEHAPLSKE